MKNIKINSKAVSGLIDLMIESYINSDVIVTHTKDERKKMSFVLGLMKVDIEEGNLSFQNTISFLEGEYNLLSFLNQQELLLIQNIEYSDYDPELPFISKKLKTLEVLKESFVVSEIAA